MSSPAIAAMPSAAAPVPAAAANGANSAASSSSAADAIAAPEGVKAVSAGFAALLLAQLGTGAELATQAAPITKGEAKDDSDKAGDPGDMSALFAALAMANPQAAVPVQTTQPAANSESISDVLQVGSKGSQGNTGALLSDATVAAQNQAGAAGNANSGTDLSGGQERKTAKFADFDAALKQTEPKPEISAPNLPDAPPAVHAAHQAHGTPNTPSVTQVRVDTPVRDPAFGQELGQKIIWMANQDKQTAQITLNPPQLGPVEVSLKISGDQATAVFASPHAEVRDAIEAALPRLREMMGSAGLELGQANVSSQSFQQQAQAQQQAQQQSGNNGRGGGQGSGILAESGSASVQASGSISRQGNGLVDTFA